MTWVHGRARVKSKVAWWLFGLWFVWLGRQQRARLERKESRLWWGVTEFTHSSGVWTKGIDWNLFHGECVWTLKETVGVDRLTQKKTRGQISVCSPVLILLFHTFKSPRSRDNCLGVKQPWRRGELTLHSFVVPIWMNALVTQSLQVTLAPTLGKAFVFRMLLLHRILYNTHTLLTGSMYVCSRCKWRLGGA